MQLPYYDKITRFILGSDQWFNLDSRLYTKGTFDVVPRQKTVVFTPEDPAHFIGETTFTADLSSWSLKLIRAIVVDMAPTEDSTDDITDPLSDLDLDLITAIESNIDPEYTKTDQDYIQRLIEFSNFRGASYLVATDLIVDYVRGNNSDYSDYMENLPLPKTTVRDLLYDGVRSVAEYIYFEITPLIIQRYIAIYKDFYNIK